MDSQGVEDLARRLAAEYEQLEASRPCDYDAWEAVRILAQESDPAAAWQIVRRLLPILSDAALGYLAAGPVEDLIDFHWVRFEQEMRTLAASSPRFREVLSMVQVGPWVPQDVRVRFQEMT